MLNLQIWHLFIASILPQEAQRLVYIIVHNPQDSFQPGMSNN